MTRTAMPFPFGPPDPEQVRQGLEMLRSLMGDQAEVSGHTTEPQGTDESAQTAKQAAAVHACTVVVNTIEVMVNRLSEIGFTAGEARRIVLGMFTK